MQASAFLHELQQLKYDFSEAAAKRKLQLLGELSGRNLPRADEVFDLHESLCYLRAFPPNAEVRDRVGQMLQAFDERKDLQRFARRLADTGIAGTRIDFRFYWLTAIWLAKQGWSRHLTIDWKEFGNKEKLTDLWHLLLPFGETPGLDSFHFEPEEWIHRLKGPKETDAEFVIDRFAALDVPTPMREKLYEDLDIPMSLEPGADTPARSRNEWPGAKIVFPQEPPSKKRPDMKAAIRKAEFTVKRLDPREGRRLIDLANSCMVPRHRDLLIFLHADPKDARLVDFGDGLQFLCVGATPERRLMLESVYGFLTLMNGYPIGYVLCSAFFNSAEVAYNVFETFRGRGAAQTYARILKMVNVLFGADTFGIDPYQLGHNNDEGLDSGAWWFYYKLGFRPHEPHIKKMVREELAAMRKNPKHRTSRARLNELASEYMFLHLGRPRNDVLGAISLGNIGLRVSEHLAARFGGDRERGIKVTSKEVAQRLGQKEKLTSGEKLAWERWAPLVDAMPDVESWSKTDKKALAKVIRAKGGRSEANYVALFDKHSKLRKALLQLAG
ncbi:MAG: hypothetical protein ACYTHK_15310 [Planctomycetota bacterium]|jgi:hypothetical protein